MRALGFLRLTNGNGHVSLTNLALIVMLVRLAVSSALGIPDVGALMLVAGLYGFRSVLVERREDRQAKASTALDLATKADVTSNALAADLKKLTEKVQAIDNRTAQLIRR